MKQLAIRTVGHDHAVLAILDGPIDVTAQDDTVIHLDGNVPIDPHAITNIAA